MTNKLRQYDEYRKGTYCGSIESLGTEIEEIKHLLKNAQKRAIP